ncbi:cobyric acid synthase [Desulfotalea psychrophila]|uniref:Cobyric acid synthase n=1 Tax=Desulfotalea psychrophila (strain LSv54 / DSM 12343) TaxID=177439 RepID=Q6ALU6_DESPS|nr:cobyric acid synthase [Desulfotalea psychrophila]CAG36679.1 related to aminotransferase and cobyric acid synthase (CobD and CobQ) [Desulfotalea psychrophila LSv54]
MIKRKEHGGNLRKIKAEGAEQKIIDFSANINPLGPPEWLRPVISNELETLIHYPDPDCLEFCQAIAGHHGISEKRVVAGNGTAELLYALLRIIPSKRIVIPVPSYIDYYHAASQTGQEIVPVELSPENGFQLSLERLKKILRPGDLALIARPNNPTGLLPDTEQLADIIKSMPEVWFCLDEAFLDFIADEPSFAGRFENVITLNSMTKFYALPGLRLGYCSCSEELKVALHNALPPWTVNTLAQAVGKRLFADETYRQQSLAYAEAARRDCFQELSSLDALEVFPSRVNYHLCRLRDGGAVEPLRKRLLQAGFAIRPCENFSGLDRSYFRVAVRTHEENHLFFQALRTSLATVPSKKKREKRPTPALMLQGTCSNAGKSVLTAALCRILVQDGIKVAPFKAQNMSLNSFVTRDGREMGRAQVVQAQAACIDPHWRMNPILLKPNSDTGSQVIVQGRPVGNMSVGQYHRYKGQAWHKVQESYDELAAEYDTIILEGAGSPGEVNLKQHDIVNMRMAQHAQSPVLLVGDIDRGGVYASFVGIMEVLSQWERDLVAGFLVNRFRGDARLLSSAHDYLLQHTGRKVLGVVPYIHQLGIPEEDSVSFKSGALDSLPPIGDHVVISVLSLPHLSNFTDIEPFLTEPDVHIRIVTRVTELENSDAIIIPGSKNVLGDMRWLQEGGFVEYIKEFATDGGTVVGICGGYQMLGRKISDPHGVESARLSDEGLGILDIGTEIGEDKKLLRKTGHHISSQTAVHGYEIHHGISVGKSAPLFLFNDGSYCGHKAENLPVWGAYLHGMFDADDFRRLFIDDLRQKKGLSREGRVLAPYNLDGAFETLAKTVRESVDMDAIYHLLGL